MKHMVWRTIIVAVMLSACTSQSIKQTQPFNQNQVLDKISGDLQQAAQPHAAPPVSNAAVDQALLPPLTVAMPTAGGQPVEPRFDLAVNAAPAAQVFMALVSGTRYSMLVHPDVKENISVNLKNVTITEALDAIRELYGYEYKIDGTRIYVEPATLQTRIFQINYLDSRRVGSADVRVTSGSIQTGGGTGAAGVANTATGITSPVAGAGTGTSGQSALSSRVTTSSDSDFWKDINDALHMIVGDGQGRNVVVNAQAGVILVRAQPAELRSVERYLRATSVMVERQVMLEAKIIEVQLNDQYSTGVNWSAFANGSDGRFAGGLINPGTTLTTNGALTSLTARAANGSLDPTSGITATLAGTQSLATGTTVPGSVFGLAFQTGDFAALLNFLETQGTAHVLSSPRIAAINNQKAVIKVGTDEFFVTNISTTVTSTGTSSTTSPTITVQPFFSGIALDVTPQISDDGQVTLHIHPSVSSVTDKNKILDLGSLGTFTLPLASSDINESDTIVRVHDGTVAAIGGLMRQQQINSNSGVPFLDRIPVVGGTLFGSRGRQTVKSELVILIKPTVIKGDDTWEDQARGVNERIEDSTYRLPSP